VLRKSPRAASADRRTLVDREFRVMRDAWHVPTSRCRARHLPLRVPVVSCGRSSTSWTGFLWTHPARSAAGPAWSRARGARRSYVAMNARRCAQSALDRPIRDRPRDFGNRAHTSIARSARWDQAYEALDARRSILQPFAFEWLPKASPRATENARMRPGDYAV